MYRIYMCDSINTRKAVEIKSIKEIRKNIKNFRQELEVTPSESLK